MKTKSARFRKSVAVQQIFVESGRHFQRSRSMSIKVLRKEHAYETEVIKMADRKTLKGPKSRSFEEKEISLLIAEWIKYTCLYDKGNKEYHDKNKREIARTHIAKPLNEQLKYDEVDSTKAITGKPETVNSWKYLFIFILVGVTDEKFNHFFWLNYRL